ncbi:MAG: type II secretion system protein GspK, partial [Syntrophales bacterium]|nr:type II secretion system protein GspK [Syntrophales bacterium]
NGGEALLMQDANNFDALTEDWAKMELLSQQSEAYFRQGSFLVRIEDETGKIPVNKMVAAGAAKDVLKNDSSVKGLLIRLLRLPDFKLDDDRVYEIVDSIQDWLDKDDEVTVGGGENSYYRTLGKAYSCKNGLLDCMDELLMIKGVSEELYFGTKETPALKDFLTIYGEGTININTAPKLVLRALSSDISADIAENMDGYRKAEGNNLANREWYKNVKGLEKSVINVPLSVKSSYFTVISMGILGKMRETVTGTVKKGQERGAAELLSWNVE